MAKQHVTMRRVYDAAIKQKIIQGANPLTELTEVLGLDAPQRVKNWDGRGASAEAMLLIQRMTGINATWIETGEGPQMVAGWPEDRVEVQADKAKPSGVATSMSEPAVSKLLTQVSSLLGRIPSGSARHRIAEMMSAWALAPDSATLLASIAADLADGGVPQEPSRMSEDLREYKMLAMRLAEAHHDMAAKALLTDYLGKLETLTREPIAPTTAKPTRTRQRT